MRDHKNSYPLEYVENLIRIQVHRFTNVFVQHSTLQVALPISVNDGPNKLEPFATNYNINKYDVIFFVRFFKIFVKINTYSR